MSKLTSPRLYSHELLKTLVTVIDSGSLARAASRLHRTQPAVSMQLRRLEEQAEQSLFEKAGRKIHPTWAGKMLYEYAKQILVLNVEAFQAMQGNLTAGVVRLSAPQDIAEDYLADVLKEFSQSYPRMQLEVRVERNQQIVTGIINNDYDVAVATVDKQYAWQPAQLPSLKRIQSAKMQWLASHAFQFVEGPIPLVLLEPPCLFRTHAIAALDKQRVSYRIAYITASLAGLRAAVEAGLGLTARLASSEDKARSIGVIKRVGHLNLPKLNTLNTYVYQHPSKRSEANQFLANLLDEKLSKN